jgi:hypothetical protein
MDPVTKSLAIKALESEAGRQGIKFVDVRDVALAVDDVTVDASDGTVRGCAGALDRLVKDRPHLIVPADGKSAGGRTSTPGSGGAGESKKNAMEMSDAEFREARKKSPVWRNVEGLM